jgi:hypothetical protein
MHVIFLLGPTCTAWSGFFESAPHSPSLSSFFFLHITKITYEYYNYLLHDLKRRRPTFPRRGRCEPSRPLADKAPPPEKTVVPQRQPGCPIRALVKGAGMGCRRFYWARQMTGAVWSAPVRALNRCRPPNRYRGRRWRCTEFGASAKSCKV